MTYTVGKLKQRLAELGSGMDDAEVTIMHEVYVYGDTHQFESGLKDIGTVEKRQVILIGQELMVPNSEVN